MALEGDWRPAVERLYMAAAEHTGIRDYIQGESPARIPRGLPERIGVQPRHGSPRRPLRPWRSYADVADERLSRQFSEGEFKGVALVFRGWELVHGEEAAAVDAARA